MTFDMHAERQTELYNSIWAQDPNYGTKLVDVQDTVDHRILPHLKRHYVSWRWVRLVDFGAGDGRFLNALEAAKDCAIDCFGVDVYQPASLHAWFKQPMWEPLGQTFDYAISTDALEHLPPSKVRETLRNIALSAPHGFLRISLTEDRYGTERGLHLHETVWPADMWLTELTVIAGIKVTSYRVYLDDKGAERALEVYF